MTAHPLDIIAEEMGAAPVGWPPTNEDLAKAAANALLDERIIDHAAHALLADTNKRGYDSPLGGTQNGYKLDALAEIALIVLRSVGGA